MIGPSVVDPQQVDIKLCYLISSAISLTAVVQVYYYTVVACYSCIVETQGKHIN